MFQNVSGNWKTDHILKCVRVIKRDLLEYSILAFTASIFKFFPHLFSLNGVN